MGIKHERRLIVESGSPLARHSLNQESIKRALEGERRLGIFPKRSESDFTKLLTALEDDETFQYLYQKVLSLDRKGTTVPFRVGQIALGISSLINRELKNNPEDFVNDGLGIKRHKFFAGSQLANLVPQRRMVINYLRETRQIPLRPAVFKHATKSAKVFAENVGGIIFNQGIEVTVFCSLIVLTNLLHYFAHEIKNRRLTIEQARKMVVAFGETTRNQLARV